MYQVRDAVVTFSEGHRTGKDHSYVDLYVDIASSMLTFSKSL